MQQINPPVFVPLHPDHKQIAVSSVQGNTAAELIAYLQTLPPDEQLDCYGPGEAEGMGWVVARYKNPENDLEYMVIRSMVEDEHRQLYPEAWEDEGPLTGPCPDGCG